MGPRNLFEWVLELFQLQNRKRKQNILVESHTLNVDILSNILTSITTDKWISLMFWWTTANGGVISHPAIGIGCTWIGSTRIGTFKIYTGFVIWTFR
jgi:hypothetical protein